MSFQNFYKDLKQLYTLDNWSIKSGTVNFISYINSTPKPTGDELNIRTALIFPIFNLLGWPAGTNPSIWNHDATMSGSGLRPDVIARHPTTQRNLFVLDTKSSNEKLFHYIPQIKEYAIQSVVQYGILANGKRLIVLDFSFDDPKIVIDLRISDLVETDELIKYKAELSEFYHQFKLDTFIEINNLRDQLAIDESHFLAEASPISQNFPTFIDEAVGLINRIIQRLSNQFLIGLKRAEEYYLKANYLNENDYSSYTIRKKNLLDQTLVEIENSGVNQEKKTQLIDKILRFTENPFHYSSKREIKKTIPLSLHGDNKIEKYIELIYKHEIYLQSLKNEYENSLIIKKSFDIWKETVGLLYQKNQENEFVTQTSYLLFVRMLFIRICEDFSVLKRQLSDGGLLSWHNFIETFFDVSPNGSGNSSSYNYSNLMSIAFNKTQYYYTHFYTEDDIFIWFYLTDRLFLEMLSVLNKYNFETLDFDIIGKIYESYVDKIEKKKRGLFYTPPEVIEYILDETDYKPSNHILSRRLIDPACGSGSFLVRAAKRLIEAHKNQSTGKIDFPEILIKRLTENIIGIDINPFSCYLAEINLYVELIKAFRGNEIPQIRRFSVFQSNSLDSELLTRTADLGRFFSTSYFKELQAVELIKSKKEKYEDGFDYVVGNPPYGANTQPESASNEDTFILFIKLGLELLSKSGKLGYILPGVWLTNTGSRGTADTMSPLRHLVLKSLDIYSVTNLFDVPFPWAYVDNIVIIGENSENNTAIIKSRVNIRHLDKLHGKAEDIVNRKWIWTAKLSQSIWDTPDHYTIDLFPSLLKKTFWEKINPANSDLFIELEGSNDSQANIIMGISPYQGYTKGTHGYTADEARKNSINFSDAPIGNDSWLEGQTKHVHRWHYFFNEDQYLWVEDYNKLGVKPRNPSCFKNKRILIRRLINRQRRLQAALVQDPDFVISKTTYAIKSQGENEDLLKYLYGILNSKVFSFLMIYVPFLDMRRIKDDMPTVEPNDIRSLPIPKPTTKKIKRISKLVDQLSQIYNPILNFIKEEGKIGIYSSSSNRTELITYENPSTFTFLTYIRKIDRISIFPSIASSSWRNYLSDWVTSGLITVNGNPDSKITTNEVIETLNPKKLILRRSQGAFSIESDNLELLNFISLIIDYYKPDFWTDIVTRITVPESSEVNNYLTSTYPNKQEEIKNQILLAWKKEDELENLVKKFYKISQSGFKLVNRVMNYWIRK